MSGWCLPGGSGSVGVGPDRIRDGDDPPTRRMRFMRYAASKDLAPARSITVNRCLHGKLLGLHMRCYSWLWRLCK
jgi:hypothetical protein